MSSPGLRGRILIIDDDPRVGRTLCRALARRGHEATLRHDPVEALRDLRELPFDLVLTDLMMPGIDGLEVLRRVRLVRPACEVIVMTAHASVATAREALKRGALDYITKPFSPERDLEPLVQRLLEAAAEEAISAAAAITPAATVPGDALVAESEPMRTLLERTIRVARSNAAVLLLGESGTGKEELASLIHRHSSRAQRPLVRVNCAALPESLLESELFGYARGAFSGATTDREGLFQAAHEGTLFLDEIGELPLTMQAKLLRVLQDGEFHRIGDPRRPVRVDVRVLAATNCDLEARVSRGEFRADLFYRLNVVPLRLPPLRERRADIPPLIERFLARFAPAPGWRFSPDALAALTTQDWPGNVRELANAVAHAVAVGDGPELATRDLPFAVARSAGVVPLPVALVESDADTLEQTEVRCILQALGRTAMNRTRAAQLLGITRRTLGYRIRKFGLEELVQQAGMAPARTMAKAAPRPNPAAGFGDRSG